MSMQKLTKINLSIVFCLLFCSNLMFAETEGEKLFKSNKPMEAALFLEDEIKNGTASSAAYNYLGLSYFQTGEYEKSVDAFAKGLKVPATNKKILSYNQGNAYYLMGDYDNAAKSYSLALSADPKFTAALLNRGNSYLMAQNYEKTIEDYERFLIMEPEDEQRPEIEEILALLRQELIRQEEEKKLLEEEAKRLAEEEMRMAEEMERQRLENERLEEVKRAQEAERRRKLLEEVANSLQNTDSTNMTSGTEDIIEYDYESELD